MDARPNDQIFHTFPVVAAPEFRDPEWPGIRRLRVCSSPRRPNRSPNGLRWLFDRKPCRFRNNFSSVFRNIHPRYQTFRLYSASGRRGEGEGEPRIREFSTGETNITSISTRPVRTTTCPCRSIPILPVRANGFRSGWISIWSTTWSGSRSMIRRTSVAGSDLRIRVAFA